MEGPRNRLKRLTDSCTVKLPPGQVTGGTGFFVASGLVISCAHVVARSDGTAADSVEVEWQGKHLVGKVRAVPDTSEGQGLWPFPDLCVVEIVDPPVHGWVVLDDLREHDRQDVYLGGYNNVYDLSTAQFQGKGGQLDEPTDLAGGRVWQITNCEMAPGMSGGPILDLRFGVVCGVAKTRRLGDTDLGGLVIPASAIRQALPEVWTRSRQASTGDSDWELQRAALREMTDLLGASLTPSERDALLVVAAELGLRREDFNALWQDIAGEFSPRPRPFNTILDLAAELCDVTSQDLDPIIKLFMHLDVRRAHGPANALGGYAESLARRNSQLEALHRYSVSPSRGAERTHPVILIRLEGYGPNPLKKSLLTVWRYAAGDAPARQVTCDRGPHTEREAMRTISAVLSREIPDLPPGPLMVEFALPDHLLDRAVETWTVDGWQLGVDYQVVLRLANRPRLEQRTWRERSGQLHSGRLPDRDSADWSHVWVKCHDHRSVEQLNAAFRRVGELPFVALAAWCKGAAVPSAMVAARHAGVPVMLWKHSDCADHGADDENGAGPCQGLRFQDKLASLLAGMELMRLPEAVRQFRAEAASEHEDAEEPGRQLAILWDDPSRFPWGDAPASAAPR